MEVSGFDPYLTTLPGPAGSRLAVVGEDQTVLLEVIGGEPSTIASIQGHHQDMWSAGDVDGDGWGDAVLVPSTRRSASCAASVVPAALAAPLTERDH